ncbi:unnamed protein product, partial [Sphacelaria rigidula]
MALSGRLRVIVTTLVPLLNRSERLAAFQVYSPRPGKPPSCNTYSCDRVPGRTNTGGATATGDRCCRIFRSSQRRPLQPLQRSLRPTSTASSAGGQLSGDTSRERGGGSIRRTAVSDASGEVVAAADQPQEKLALTMEDARKALKSLFGHDDFRDGQAAVVTKLISGESCAAIFPTGAGKSICYQLPGTLMAERGLGLTLVVSPLIALMKDQTDALIAAGVPCAKLDSTLAAHEIREIYEQASLFIFLGFIRAGVISLLYVSPERFNNERFIRALKGVKVALFVVDEAHCISE